jgi:class 3 adenylate cyclase/tetratricopeptide (TPR) repeat protein
MITLSGSSLQKKAFILTGLLLIFCRFSYSQNQQAADSLIYLYESGNFHSEDRLEILYNISINHPDPEKILMYSEELLVAAETLGANDYLFNGYLGKGTALRLKGNIPEALESYLKASDIASDHQMTQSLGRVTAAIGDAYSIMENHTLAINYYKKGVNILREVNDSLNIATVLLNTGDEYFKYGELDSALTFYKESGDIFNALEHDIGEAYNLGNIGQVYAELGQYEKAIWNLNQAIQMLTELGDYYPICVYLITISDIYLEREDENTALDYAEQSLELAKSYGLKEQISDANLIISELYEILGQPDKSISYYKDHIIYRDSVNSIVAVQEMAELRTEYEVAQKQAEVDILVKESEIADLKGRRQRWVIFGTGLSLIFVAFLAINAFRSYKFVQKTNVIIEEEKNKSDNLLLNILPHETASELKEHGSVKARKIEGVTVLFTDFVEFTRIAEEFAPEQVVRSIDHYFKKFDEITTRHNLEKIKTIGDSYMCAGGLHSESPQANEILKAALEMVTVIEDEKKSNSDLIRFDIRIGVHTGPVVAGIVGTKKWQYDIWGDTVNIASGMESNSVPGMINISETTYKEVTDEFQPEFRGEMEIKNRGYLKMYFVS